MSNRLEWINEGLEEAAQYLDGRADEVEKANGGGSIQNMMSRIFRDEASSVRKLKRRASVKKGSR